MADIPKISSSDLDAYSSLIKKAQKLKTIWQEAANEHGKASIEALRAKQAYQKAGSAIEEFVGRFGALGNVFLKAQHEQKSVKNSLSALGFAFNKIGLNAGGLMSTLGKITKSVVGFGAMAVALRSNVIRGMIMPFQDTKKIVDSLPAPLRRYNDVVRAHRKVTDDVRRALVMMGKGHLGAAKSAEKVIRNTAKLSRASGFYASDIMKVASALSEVKADAIVNLRKASVSAAREGKGLAGAMNVMRGAGFKLAQITSIMPARLKQFGEKGLELSKQIRILHSAVEGTKFGIDMARKQIEGASMPLAIFGQKSGVAARTWRTFVDSLKDTIPIENIGRLVTQLTSKIANMSIGTRAFITQMSGMMPGSGALGGALKMEMALRSPGGLEKNLQAMTKTLSRFGGGRIISLKQATQNPALQMQFQLQRQLVGQLTGVQGGQAQARVLEVLQRMQSGGMSQLDASKTIRQLSKAGQTLQQKSLTAMERLVQQSQDTNRLLHIIANVDRKIGRGVEHARRIVFGETEQKTVTARSLSTGAAALARGVYRGIRAGERGLSKLWRRIGIRMGARRDQPPKPVGRIITGQERTRVPARDRPPARTTTPIRTRNLPAAFRLPNVRLGQPARRDPFSALRLGTLTQLAPRNRAEDFRRGAAALRRTADADRKPTAREIVADALSSTHRDARGGIGSASAVPDAITVKVTCEQCGHNLKQHIEKLAQGARGQNEPGRSRPTFTR